MYLLCIHGQHLQLYHSAFSIPLHIEVPFFRIPTMIPVLIIVYEVVTSKYSSWFIKCLLVIFWVAFVIDFAAQGALQTDDILFHLKHSIGTHLIGNIVITWLSFLVEDLRIKKKFSIDPSTIQQSISFRPEVLNLVVFIVPPIICLLSYHGPWYTATSQLEKDKHIWELIAFMKRNTGVYESSFQNNVLKCMTINFVFLSAILCIRPFLSGTYRSRCFDIFNVFFMVCFICFFRLFYNPLQVTMMETTLYSPYLPTDWIWKMFAAHLVMTLSGVVMIFISWIAQEAYRLDTLYLTAATLNSTTESKQKKT